MLGNKKTWNGFTIVELTVALLVSAIVLATGYELFKALRNAASGQDRSMTESHQIVDALEQIREDLLYAVPKAYDQNPMFVGSNPIVDFEKCEILKFYSLCVTGYPDEICAIRQIHRVGYELVKEEDSTCLYRSAVSVMKKNESPYDENRKLIINRIDQVSIFFHNGNKLLPSFSSKQHLPVYVKFEFIIDGQAWLLATNLLCCTEEMEQGL